LRRSDSGTIKYKERAEREACTSIGGSQGNLADLRSVLSWKSPPKTPCKGSVVTDNHRSIARWSNRAKNRTKDIVFARELEKHGGVKTVEMPNLRFQLREMTLQSENSGVTV
jgi:hypothetical protein